MPITGIAATSPQKCGALRRDSSVTTSDIAPAVAIATSVASRELPRRSLSCTGTRGVATRPTTTATMARNAAATGSIASCHVATASAAVASHAKVAAQPAWTTSAARAKPAPSRTVRPVPHRVPSTACVA